MSSTDFSMMYAEYPSRVVLLPSHACENNDRVWLHLITSTGIPLAGAASLEFMKQKSALIVGTSGELPVTRTCCFIKALA